MGVWGNAVQEHYVNKFRNNFEQRKARLASIKTKEQAEAYVAEIREKIRGAFSFPAEKCDLNVRVTGRKELPDCNIELILFDSRPSYPVSAAVYLPKKIEGKVPAVLVLCGHAVNGKACPTYQIAGRSMAKQGIIAICPDPFGQGERKQYYTPDINNVVEHNIINRRLLPMGDNTGNWRTWDAIRAIDYLVSRDDVDTSRLGIAGNSGGGTMTSIVNAVEDRLSAACPNCYITRWHRNIENELPVDAEQIIEGAAANGGDMADLLLAVAPRPIAIGGQANDFFDIRGTREVYEEVKHIYTILGYPERVHLTVGPVSHGFSPHLREASYKFFAETFQYSKSEPVDITEPMLTDEEMFCTPNGRTIDLPGTVTIHDLIQEQLKATIANRKSISKAEAVDAINNILKIGDAQLPTYRQLRNRSEGLNNNYSRYGLEIDRSMVTTLFCASTGAYFKLAPEESVELYVPHLDSVNELEKRKVGDKQELFAIDYRGVGESTPDGCDQVLVRNLFQNYRFDYHYASVSLLMGESYLGDRVRDILGAIELLSAYGAKKIKLTSSGIGRIPALFAALLTDKDVQYTPAIPLSDLENQVRDAEGTLPQSMLPIGLLKITDFSELERLVR
ncbi:MAG: acetylxylan esterase [Lentisphaeria bacterium]|nr:acetylxylan esterase [Lentisphaeria bacterium]